MRGCSCQGGQSHQCRKLMQSASPAEVPINRPVKPISKDKVSGEDLIAANSPAAMISRVEVILLHWRRLVLKVMRLDPMDWEFMDEELTALNPTDSDSPKRPRECLAWPTEKSSWVA